MPESEIDYQPHILPIDILTEEHIPIVGRKAFSLSRMRSMNLKVPVGFVISTSAFDGTEDLKVSDKLQDELLNAWKEFGLQKAAVRSSSVLKSGIAGEDSSERSWAGIFDTVLNVGPEKLVEAVETVWRSSRSNVMAAYAFDAGVNITDVSMAVIVQEMIDADIAGVADSSINESDDIGVIEAAMGLGETIVSGVVSPDQYYIDNTTGSIAVRIVRDQTRVARSVKERVELQVVPAIQDQKVTDSQISDVWQSMKRLEELYGGPVDVEWAIRNSELYFTQARPLILEAERQQLSDDNFYPTLLDDRKWVRRVIRPWSLFVTSMTCRAGMTQQARDIGFYIGETLNIETSPREKVDHLWSHETVTKIFDDLKTLSVSDQEKLRYIFDQARAYSNEAERVLTQDSRRFISLEDIVRFTNDTALFGTILPFALLEAIEEGKNTELDEVGDELRKRSFHAQLTMSVVRPYAINRLKELGVEDEQAVDLLTINEILSGNIGSYRYRKKARELDKKFVYQNVNGKEVVIWLDDTEAYLKKTLEEVGATTLTNRLRGVTAYPGYGEGPAYIALFYGSAESDIRDGSVLITLNGHPSLRPLMEHSTAIVSQEGGRTAHIARLAKEIKVPCIMGVSGIVDIVKDGDLIKAFGDDGYIEIQKK